MTDTTQPQPQAQLEPAAPVDELQANIDAFFGHRLSDPTEETPPTETVVQPQVETPPVGLNPPSPTPAPNADPAASQNEGGEPEVDPDLVASVLLGQTQPQAQPQEQQPAQPSAASAPPSSDEGPFMPIKPEAIRLPQAQLDAIFRSEDPQEQERALVNLMASWMNAGIALMDSRMKEHYAPQFVQQSQQVFATQAATRAIEEDFFGAYPDLQGQTALIERVAAHFAKTNPQAKWGPELRDKIGTNARALAKQLGIKLAGAPQAQPQAPAQPFVVDSARPASAMPSGQVDYGPAAMVDELTRF